MNPHSLKILFIGLLVTCQTIYAEMVHDNNIRWANENLADEAAMSLEKDLAIHKRWLDHNKKVKDGGSAAGYYLRETVKTWYYNRQDTMNHDFKSPKNRNSLEYDFDTSSDEIELKVKFNF